jgi:hypothetical protein
VNFGEIVSDVGCRNRVGVFSVRILVVLLCKGNSSPFRYSRVVVQVPIFLAVNNFPVASFYEIFQG